MKTLVFLEDHEGKLQKDSLGVLSKAASLDGEVEAVLLGTEVAGLAGEAARFGAARVAPTAPPSAFASPSTSVKFSGPPSPRPPATMTGASSIDGPSLSSCAWSTMRADVEKSSSATVASSTSGEPPLSAGSNDPERKSASLGPDFQPTST